jgi:mono/diheme cytochrome c family protein
MRPGPGSSEHFQEKWNPVFRPKMRQCKNARAASFSSRCETTLALLALSLAAAATPVVAQSPDGRFGNPARFVPMTGEGLYADICQGCHMPGGVGAVGAGAYPALALNPKLAAAGYPLTLVIRGRNGMPPFGDLLTDEQVAAVVNYVRSHFGNHFADDVTAADAKAARP